MHLVETGASEIGYDLIDEEIRKDTVGETINEVYAKMSDNTSFNALKELVVGDVQMVDGAYPTEQWIPAIEGAELGDLMTNVKNLREKVAAPSRSAANVKFMEKVVLGDEIYPNMPTDEDYAAVSDEFPEGVNSVVSWQSKQDFSIASLQSFQD